MRRNLPFIALVALSLAGLGAFYSRQGRAVGASLHAMDAYEAGVGILDDESLTPETQRALATSCFAMAVSDAPPELGMERKIATAAAKAKAYDIALEHYEAILAQGETLQDLLAAAQCAYRMADVEAARPLYERAMELFPDDPAAYNGLGYLLAEEGVDLDEAEKLINKAIELHAKRAEARTLTARPTDRLEEAMYRDSLGWVYVKQGRAQEALVELEAAAAVIPGSLEVQAHLRAAREAVLMRPREPGGDAEAAPRDA
jgi:tetratricopeptide (TPR) repeat protein